MQTKNEKRIKVLRNLNWQYEQLKQKRAGVSYFISPTNEESRIAREIASLKQKLGLQ
jgi:acetate kinase